MSIKLSVSIMAHPKRADFVKEIQNDLGFKAHVEWDRGISLWDTARRSWLSYNPKATHHLVLQDDVIISKDLIKTLEKALEYIPEDIISICTIKYRFNKIELQQYTDHYNKKFPWYTHSGILSGPAIIVPVAYIEDMIKYCDTLITPHDDLRIKTYCNLHGIPIRHSVPSLVEHKSTEENPSLLRNHDDKKRGNRQTVIFIGRENSGLNLDWKNIDYLKNL